VKAGVMMRFLTARLINSTNFYFNVKIALEEAGKKPLTDGEFHLISLKIHEKIQHYLLKGLLCAEKLYPYVYNPDSSLKKLNKADCLCIQELAAQCAARCDAARSENYAMMDALNADFRVPYGIKKLLRDDWHEHKLSYMELSDDMLTLKLGGHKGLKTWYIKTASGWQMPDLSFYFDNGRLEIQEEDYFRVADEAYEYNMLLNFCSSERGRIFHCKTLSPEMIEKALQESAAPQDGFVELSIGLTDAHAEHSLMLESGNASETLKAANCIDRYGWQLEDIFQAENAVKFMFRDGEHKKKILHLKTVLSNWPEDEYDVLDLTRLRDDMKTTAMQVYFEDWVPREFYESWCEEYVEDWPYGVIEYVIDFHDFNRPGRKRWVGCCGRVFRILVTDAWQEVIDG
jgi:hypothetical protein